MTSPLALPHSSPGTSTDPSLYSGSMDSYASQPAGTSATSTTDMDDKWKDFSISETLSPRSIESGQVSPGDTERQDSSQNPFDKLKPISTDVTPTVDEPEEVVFASPTSEEGTPVS